MDKWEELFMADQRKLIVKLAKMITDCVDVELGKTKMDKQRPEYWMLDLILTDEMAELALKMGVRKHTTAKELAKKIKWNEAKVERLLDEMSDIGFVEYNWHNSDHHKQYVIPVFVVGSAENFLLNKKLLEKYPKEVGEFQDQMAYLPLVEISHMVPPGGAGMGFHVIPVESAISKESQSLEIEHISYWLKKYPNQYAIIPCVCRRSMRLQGKGCGELEEGVCIAIGDYADYLLETDKEAKKASYDEIIDLLERTEENGYMHQVTNGDGKDDIFAICNCTIGSCFGLRCSQLFNNPNLSASAYRAEVRTEYCVACGKCVEVCPTGAAKLGQKLCTEEGKISYAKQPLPDETSGWGKDNWNMNYRDDNQINCYDTGTAPCKTACPAHIAVQGYIKMAAQGRYLDALKLIKQDNPFPAVCGSICNRRCEDACTRGNVDDPIAIDEIKKFIAQQELKEENRYIPKKIRHRGSDEDYTEKIAVIGAGPAGMSCAYFLANMGYPVTVFDKNPVPGGMLVMGLPNFRLEKDVLNAEIDVLRKMGVDFRCGIEVGKDTSIKQLRAEGYKGFCVAIGAQGGRKLGISGEEAIGCISGIDFLRQMALEEKPHLNNEKTIVIGGGNVAVDVARSAVRVNGKDVEVFSLEQRNEMPASVEELKEAENENIKINCGWGPKEILSTADGKVRAVVFKKCLSVKDSDGRFNPIYDEDDTITIPCEHVLATIGQSILWGDLLSDTAVELNRNMTAKVDFETYQTAEPDIYVCGDAFTGPRFAIDAIAGGREVAISLHRFVHSGHSLTLARNKRNFKELDKKNLALPIESYDAPDRQVPLRNKEKEKTMYDERMVFTEEQIKAEVSRCLGCGATIVDRNKCIGCGICTTKCNFDAIKLTRNHPEFAHYVSADETKKAIMKHGIKRAIKLKIKDMTNKTK